jgi:hypothetical protein
VIEWTSNKSDLQYTIRFVDQNGNNATPPFVGWSTSSQDSVNGVVSGTIMGTPSDVVYKYNVETAGGTLDPQIIIET